MNVNAPTQVWSMLATTGDFIENINLLIAQVFTHGHTYIFTQDPIKKLKKASPFLFAKYRSLQPFPIQWLKKAKI